jgi:minor histocompatibility antigen H13
MGSEAAPSLLDAIYPFLPTYSHLLFAALLPIYAGAHASLRRPLNTLSPTQLKALQPAGSSHRQPKDEEDVDDEPASHVEQLTATDAMMFPVTAGALLGGLYLIIKYFNDPTLLSRILTWYFCAMGVFAVGKSFADTLGVAVEYIFPDQIHDSQGRLLTAGFDAWKIAGETKEDPNPIPHILTQPFLSPGLWSLRRTLRARWNLDLSFCGENIKKTFWLGELLGPLVGAAVVAVYTAGGKHWLLSNIMGISFSYGAMQLISPTTFPIATLLMGLLFVYDIFFVFYTPLMVTVATNLDVPIKLLFPRPGTTADGSTALAMLGLGDIVLPGLVVAMALRWDCWRFYELKRRALLAVARSGKGELSKEEMVALRPRYNKAVDFPKTYFNACLVAYTLAMFTTLGVMHVFQHAQPALLYLVPGVLGAVWGTALVKGEARVMWNYTEEGEPEPDIVKKMLKQQSETVKKVLEKVQATEIDSVKGELEKTVLTLKLVRQPAPGARRVPPPPPPVELPVEDSSDEEEEEEDDDDDEGSTSSGEVVEKSEVMWGTTVIDQQT